MCTSSANKDAGARSSKRSVGCFNIRFFGNTSDTERNAMALREPWVNPLAKMARSAHTLCLGCKLHVATKKLRRRLKKIKDLDEDEEQNHWDELHKSNAQMVLQHIYRYRGFFSKLGQSLSAKKAHLPVPWVETLEPLQNQMPVTKFTTVQRTVQKELGKPLKDVFADFEETPIASASVAQAHIASLRSLGHKVCVKVQHPGVAALMGTDLTTVELLLWFMKRLNSDAPDLTEIAKEWRRTSKEEVDFLLEAKNAALACHALKSRGSGARSCEPLLTYCTNNVLTMRFVDGWKITETEKFPFGSDREAVGRQLLDAFAMLVFEEGLIHGDPHPGNIFVQPCSEGSTNLRPVFLDWGIVKRLQPSERVALARWVVASLSMDRVLYAAALRELGFEFKADLSAKKLEQLMQGGMMVLRDSIPNGAMRQFVQQREKIENDEKERAKAKAKQSGAKASKDENPMTKFSGTVLYFFRGLQLLHDCCGTLEVTIPVAKVMLKYALPLLGSPNLHPLPKSTGRSDMERSVLAKLEELKESGTVLGAQVAVLHGGLAHTPDAWLCDLSFGMSGAMAAPISEQTLMPLLGVGTGALIACLLAALARPTAAGKSIGLDTCVEELWPEFSRRGKNNITISQLLQHRAGILRPFPCKFQHKSFCDERKMEEAISACPLDEAAGVCPVVGAMAAALLRRATGQQSAANALQKILAPLGIEEDIVYHSEESRMASVGHKLLEEVSIATMWEVLEQREQRGQQETETKDKKGATWNTLTELADVDPWCADPLLVNSEDLRSGAACATGRGLRATAKALCRLYGADSDFIPANLLARSCVPQGKIQIATQEDWEELGRCLDISSAGWQLFRFEPLDGGEEVQGHGHADGTTGSIALRIPGFSIAILLNCVDKAAQHAGMELLSVIAAHLGFDAAWLKEQLPLDLPSRKDCAKAECQEDIAATLRKLETQVARLTKALDESSSLGVGSFADAKPEPGNFLIGQWVSAEMIGFDEMLDIFNVPALARSLAKKMQRKLRIQVRDAQITISMVTIIARRQIENSEITFQVGEQFQGTGLGGAFQAVARWACGDSSGPLVVEKRSSVGGRNVTVEEIFSVGADGRLSLETCVKGRGEVDITVSSSADLDLLRRTLDARNLRLKKDVDIGGIFLYRGGQLDGVGSMERPPSVSDVAAMCVPGNLRFRYEDIRSKMFFDFDGVRAVNTHFSAPSSLVSTSSTLASEYSRTQMDMEGSGTSSAVVIMEGISWKRSRHLRQWRQRRLVLTYRELRCFKERMRLTERIPMDTVQQVYSAEDILPVCLCVKTARRCYYFTFGNVTERDKWIMELSRLRSRMP